MATHASLLKDSRFESLWVFGCYVFIFYPYSDILQAPRVAAVQLIFTINNRILSCVALGKASLIDTESGKEVLHHKALTCTYGANKLV